MILSFLNVADDALTENASNGIKDMLFLIAGILDLITYALELRFTRKYEPHCDYDLIS